MKQVLISQGKAIIEEVPAPAVDTGCVLVRLSHSCISTGTELSGMKSSGTPLWKKAFTQPEKVKKAIHMVMTEGFSKTKSQIEGKLSTGMATGYSAAGIVIEKGEGVNDINVGERVACAGAQFAHHAEIVRVPRNLIVSLPKDLDFSEASTVALGSIALQGIRRANPTLGEVFVVIGLGFLGQLTAQMLKSNGCRVIGVDLDSVRLALAQKLGVDHTLSSSKDVEELFRFTNGVGVDGVIITAATPSNDVVSKAFMFCRKKGRVVLVGDVGLNLNRADFYQKEIDFLISSSYGPGRYDPSYEEKGVDYPLSYVRWTENRNMAEYVRLLAEKMIKISDLIHSIFPIEKAEEAYRFLNEENPRPLLALLSYTQNEGSVKKTIFNPKARPFVRTEANKKIRIAVIGASSFAKGVHLPNIQALSQLYYLRAVVSRTGHNAQATAKQFCAEYASTDFQEVLHDEEIDAVLITTRHHLHASMALEALRSGKHVLLEKPLALTREELEQITNFYEKTPSEDAPILLTGFNRRFSKFIQPIHAAVQKRTSPLILNYRMNAGYIPMTDWVHGPEGGGRNIGEACHIYDLFTFLTGSEMDRISVNAIQASSGYYSSKDNFVTTISFKDGSIATLIYTALGSKDFPKEYLEVYCDGSVLVMDDYCRLAGFGNSLSKLHSKIPSKGQKEELEAFAQAINNGGSWPIPLWQQIQATNIAFKVEDMLNNGIGLI